MNRNNKINTNNIIHTFHLYKCKKHFIHVHLYPKREIEDNTTITIKGIYMNPLYLSLFTGVEEYSFLM